MVAIETIINGGRAVATNLGIYKELVGNNIIYVSSAQNEEKWLEKIQSLKKNKKINKKKILNKFSHKNISDKYFRCIAN